MPPHGTNGLPVLAASYGSRAPGLEDLFTPNWPWPREPWETASDLWTCVRWITYGTTFGADVAALLRDITGNPFRPVGFDPAWCTDTVRALARGIDEAGTFEALPILADALQDAGCEDRGILDHCRAGGPHVPGCWVVDLAPGRP
ncbi:Uncharacterized protein (Fragment) OS=uncultured bacterium PE=4 SV=1 [Gemmata massiliana]|uniref:Uncharacterized protein n=1 Tax=Gemmata massiliana TaxID=1210884 RepID=A0A6P2DJH6_9BACT